MGLLRFALRKVSPSHDIFEQRAPARHPSTTCSVIWPTLQRFAGPAPRLIVSRLSWSFLLEVSPAVPPINALAPPVLTGEQEELTGAYITSARS
jgi:hypothetical protein